MAQWMCSSKKERETASVCARREIDSGNRRGDKTTTKREKEGTTERVKATWLRLVERKERREGGEEVRTAPAERKRKGDGEKRRNKQRWKEREA